MAQLFLPLAHTDADLVLAGLIAERIDSAELYVTWTPEQGHAVPEVMAELRTAAPGLTGTLTLVLEAFREVWAVLRGRPPRHRAVAPAAAQPAQQPKPAA
jgi:hypothetical protein